MSGRGVSNPNIPANENRREEMTLEAIERDPWNAVDLPLPDNADRTFLAAAGVAADQCFKAAFAAARVAEIVDPGRVASFVLRSTEAAARAEEARRDLGALPAEQVSKVSPFLHPDRVQEKALMGVMGGTGAGEPEPQAAISDAAIDSNRWSVVWSDLAGAGPDLLKRVVDTSAGLIGEALQRRDESSYSREEAALWNHYAAAARDTVKDAQHELALIAARGASRPPQSTGPAIEAGPRKAGLAIPELTAERIALDPWSAVTAPIPEDASLDLLGLIQDSAARLKEHAFQRGDAALNDEDADHWFNLGYAAETRFEIAGLKLDEVAAREAWRAPAFSRATIAAEPWTAVYLPIPEGADAELLTVARNCAADLKQRAAGEGALPQIIGNDRIQSREENLAATEARVAELDRRLETLRNAEPLRDASQGNSGEVDRELDAILRDLEEGHGVVEIVAMPPPLTREAIARDPWNAVALDMPANADRELLSEIAATARAFRHVFNERANAAGGALAEELFERGVLAKDREKEAESRLLMLEAGVEERLSGHGGELRSAEDIEMEQPVFARAAFDATEPDAQLRQAWSAAAFSRETIEADPWTAVYLLVPAKADAWLLMKAHDATGLCQELIARGNGPRLPQGNDGAAENMERATARAEELSQEIHRVVESSRGITETQASVPLRPERVRTSGAEPPGGVGPEQERGVGNGAREPVTAEAIARDPWNAVRLELPRVMSVELAGLVIETAYELRNQVAAASYREADPEVRQRLNDLWDQADERRNDAFAVYDRAKEREAWQAPAFSRETIYSDSWTAVYLPVPEEASRRLLEHARGCVSDLQNAMEAGELDLRALGPAVNRDTYTREGNLAAAAARLGELDARLEALRAVETASGQETITRREGRAPEREVQPQTSEAEQ
jgi:hypothetical protein